MGPSDSYAVYLAKQMRPDIIEDGQLPKDLVKFLGTVDSYAERAGGMIRSRQVVALAIAMWDLFSINETFQGEDY